MFAIILTSCNSMGLRALRGSFPDPELDVREVVSIQLRALQSNNRENEGIAIVYRFAAPSNKVVTGPIDRFTRLFETRSYSPMLGSQEIELLDSRVEGRFALQRVRVVGDSGQEVFYLFVLEKQQRGNYEDCWMTISVQLFSGDLPGPEFDFDFEAQSI